jgi:glycosyltransferase involved in cell wall biosynthesis
MLTLYAQADGFCLPSLSDPNPLSVIEALWAGLPLLLSTKVGNHPECLEQGKNGFAFDPLKASSVQRAISNWMALSPDELADFGKRSKLTAYANFWPYTVIPSFIEQILPEPWRSLVMAAADASR